MADRTESTLLADDQQALSALAAELGYLGLESEHLVLIILIHQHATRDIYNGSHPLGISGKITIRDFLMADII